MQSKRSTLAKQTRWFRKIHRWVGIPLVGGFLLLGFTGLLLGWKKQAALLPPTQRGQSTEAAQWLSLDSLQHLASTYATRRLQLDPTIDRLDIRPQKGIVKVVFLHHFTELQLDCTTGRILSVATRSSDFIEKIHDGSIVDWWLQGSGDAVKLSYTSLVGLGMVLLAISGFYLWFNPWRMQR